MLRIKVGILTCNQSKKSKYLSAICRYIESSLARNVIYLDIVNAVTKNVNAGRYGSGIGSLSIGQVIGLNHHT